MLTIPKNRKFLRGTTFIDLFAGLGGFRLAVESFGGECVFSSDFDKNVADLYETNFGERLAGDITKIAAKTIPPHDILCAGFPCQPFSVAGKQVGFADTRGTLFFDIVRIAKQHKPKLLFLENVKNFVRHDNGNTIRVVTKTLELLGYTVYYELLNASNYGIPQTRTRVYILAFRNDLNVTDFCFPKARPTRTTLEDLLDSDQSELEVDIDYELVANYETLVIGLPKRPVRIGQIGLGRQGERIYHPKGHAITITAASGGIGGKTGLYLIDGRIRRLSPRECARLNGFPEWFKLYKRPTVAYKQLGNSVVVDVLQHILGNCVILGK